MPKNIKTVATTALESIANGEASVEIQQRMKAEGFDLDRPSAQRERQGFMDIFSRLKISQDRRIDALSQFVQYEHTLHTETIKLVKRYIETELTTWVEKTSAFHFIEVGEKSVVPLWMLIGDWGCPAVRHEKVEALIAEVDESKVESYRQTVRDFNRRIQSADAEAQPSATQAEEGTEKVH